MLLFPTSEVMIPLCPVGADYSMVAAIPPDTDTSFTMTVSVATYQMWSYNAKRIKRTITTPYDEQEDVFVQVRGAFPDLTPNMGAHPLPSLVYQDNHFSALQGPAAVAGLFSYDLETNPDGSSLPFTLFIHQDECWLSMTTPYDVNDMVGFSVNESAIEMEFDLIDGRTTHRYEVIEPFYP
jgi:hypothetical protein